MKPLALITGASRGVGRALALELNARGHRLALLGRPSPRQEETAALLREAGAEFTFFTAELSDRLSTDAATRAVLSQLGVPDVVIHSAGIIERAPVSEQSDAGWDALLEVNLTAPFRLTRALLPDMLKRQSGRILFVSSISAVVGTKNQSAYHASKAGVVALMRCLAEELSNTGVFTAAVLPGSIDTEMLQGSGFEPRMTPAEVAQTLAFYALDAGFGHHGAAVEMFGV